MTELTEADATFTVDAWEETPYDEPADGPTLTRVVVRKTYDGPIRGHGVAEVLTAQGEGSGYVASERVVGSLDGREGTFVIQHGGLANPDGSMSTFGTIVPASGTGDLAGIVGEVARGDTGHADVALPGLTEESMVIVAGHLLVAPERRDAYLAGCAPVVEQARAAHGCLDFALSADLLDAGRVNILERWESQADVEAFRGAGTIDEQGARILAASVAEYDVADIRSLTG